MSDTFEKEILKDYLEIPGASRSRAVAYRVLTVPDLSFSDYVAIRKSRPTIFSNLCWGGILYRHLDLECCSPTKNLWIAPKQYLKMLENLEYYMSVEPELLCMEEVEYPPKVMHCPVLLLDDIKVHCNHTESAEQAICSLQGMSMRLRPNWAR